MNTPTASLRAWARQLLLAEAANPSASDSDAQVAVRVIEKSRISLTRFVGVNGFTAMLRRALALARTDASALQTVTITADGRLEGFQELTLDEEKGVEAAIAITAHLLGLLVTFIGESLALRLMGDAWPGTSSGTRAKSQVF